MFDALLSESSANRCSWVVCAAAISGFGLKAGIWACRHVPPRLSHRLELSDESNFGRRRPTWAEAGSDCRSNNYQQGINHAHTPPYHRIRNRRARRASLRHRYRPCRHDLKISHQFPAAPSTRAISATGSAACSPPKSPSASGGEIAAEIYPNSSLIKTNAQFSAMRKGALDISLYPLPYAGGELPETNIGLMPGLVSTYDQGLNWKKQPVGKALTDFLADKGIDHPDLGLAGRRRRQPLQADRGPEDAKGLKVRGGSREMDMVLQTAGAAVLSVPSNELYAAMQTGACDAGITSSTSLISFRLEEVAKSLTSGAGASYWFMLEPLMMSKAIFDKLPKNQQDIILSVGSELEAFGRKGAQDDDVEVAKVYEKAGAKVSKLDARPSASGAISRATPRGRTTAPRPRPRQSAEARQRRLPHDAWSASGSDDRRAPPRAIRSWRRSTRRWPCNNVIVVFAALALVAACVILSYSVLGRALFHSPITGRTRRRCSCWSAPPS
jgi:TRAP-type C4-dicarboxylate transport system substrate-binding protein